MQSMQKPRRLLPYKAMQKLSDFTLNGAKYRKYRDNREFSVLSESHIFHFFSSSSIGVSHASFLDCHEPDVGILGRFLRSSARWEQGKIFSPPGLVSQYARGLYFPSSTFPLSFR